MKNQELAAIRCAVKRSVKANSTDVGYNFLLNWRVKWKDTCNIMLVMKCFKKWVKRQAF
jgi:hypothetical protein